VLLVSGDACAIAELLPELTELIPRRSCDASAANSIAPHRRFARVARDASGTASPAEAIWRRIGEGLELEKTAERK
jgi:hypothetical protein